MPGENTPLPLTGFSTPCFEFDFPRLRIGMAEYDEGPTGCTVFLFDQGAVTAVDIRGGMPGVVESEYRFHHAICFAGGSLHGLEAVSGVRSVLTAKETPCNPPPLPLVAGAIIFDWFKRKVSSTRTRRSARPLRTRRPRVVSTMAVAARDAGRAWGRAVLTGRLDRRRSPFSPW